MSPAEWSRTRAVISKFFDKAGCARAGPQKTASRLWPEMKKHLTPDEESAVSIGWGHATLNSHAEGRGELDGVRARVLKRLDEQYDALFGK